MKREDLKAKGLTEEQIDFVMAENGKDVETHKTKLTAAETERDGLKTQLTEANETINGFKAMKIEDIQKAAADWEAKAKKAETDRVAEVSQLKFDHALESALTGAKAKNAKAVKALLQMDSLKLNEADGSILGLKEQLEKVKADNDYLFTSDAPDPQIILGGNGKPINTDTFLAAGMRGAGLPIPEGK